MGRLAGIYEWPTDCAGQAARDQDGRGGGDMETNYGEVPPEVAKAACGTTQLAGGLKAGIEGAIHAVRVLWEEHKMEKDWVFILIDVRNAFNEEN